MRIRSTKPEFWRSKTIADLPWDVRLVLKGLESYVDDNGVGKDDIALIAADVFPRDLSRNPRDTLARLSEAISMLSEHGLIARYEVDGENLLYIDRWRQQQRIDKPAKGRFPRPDGTFNYADDVNPDSYRVIRDTLARVPEILAPGTGEQGNRGTGEQSSSSEVADATLRPDVDEILNHLDAAIKANGAKVPSRTKKNLDAARLLLDRDGKTVGQVKACIDFATTDEFWRTNILSMSKLRDKYDQLRMKATAGVKVRQQPTLPGGDYFTPPEPPEDMPPELFLAWNRAHVEAHRENRPGPTDWREVAA